MAALETPQARAGSEAARAGDPADGAGVVWALGRQGDRVRRRPGIELAQRLPRPCRCCALARRPCRAQPVVMAGPGGAAAPRWPGLIWCSAAMLPPSAEVAAIEQGRWLPAESGGLAALVCHARKPGSNACKSGQLGL